MNNMDYIKKVNERFGGTHTEKCLKCPYFWLRYNSLQYNTNTQNFFEQYKLADLKVENTDGAYVGSYKVLEDKIIEHYRKTYMLQDPARNRNDLKQEILDSFTDEYENKTKEMLKSVIDMAAQATQENNPQLSILFEGIGLIYADNLVEAVDKVISMLDTAMKANEHK